MSGVNLVLDIQAFQDELQFERGIPRYIREHSRALLNINPIYAFSLNPRRIVPRDLPQDILLSGKVAWGSGRLLRTAASTGQIVYHVMSPFENQPDDTIYPWPLAREGAFVMMTIYDLIPLIRQDLYLSESKARSSYLARLELPKFADLLLAISDSARNDAIRLLGLEPEKVVTIGTGVSSYFNKKDRREQDASLCRNIPITKEFIFTVLGHDVRKNLDGLLAAYRRLPARVRNKYQLVVGGKLSPEAIAETLRRTNTEVMKADIIFPGYVPDQCLRALYRSTALFVFPSLHEGFGLPVAEAISCGSPVVISRIPALLEILARPDASFDPNSPDEMAAVMERALEDPEFARRLRDDGDSVAQNFTWSAVAERTVAAVAARLPRQKRILSSQRSSQRPSTRLAVGFVGPFPPERSGIADYNFRICRELARHADVTAFYTKDSDPALLTDLGFTGIYPISALGRSCTPQYFDRVIYTFGNSTHHFESFDAFRQWPGILWLHDLTLSGFYFAYGVHHGNAHNFVRSSATRMYGEQAPVYLFEKDFGIPELVQAGLRFARELASFASAIIVSSQASLNLLRFDWGPRVSLPPCSVLPLAGYSSGQHTSARDALRVASFGIIDYAKAPDLLLEAFALVRERAPLAQLTFFGEGHPDLIAELLQQTRDLGIEAAVEFRGHVDEAEWISAICSTTCAVQLRRSSNGEGSAAVMACLSHGLPVITNVASCHEMPGDARLWVPYETSAEELSAAIMRVLLDSQVWDRLQAGGLAYVAQNTYEQVALRLVHELTHSLAAA